MTGRSSAAKDKQTLPMLPLRDVVVYPFMVIPLFVGRDKSIAALEAAMEKDEPVFLLAQLNPSEEDPKAKDLHKMGTIANVLQMLKLPDGTVKVLVEGVERAQVVSLNDSEQDYFVASVERVQEFQDDPVDTEAMRRALLSPVLNYIHSRHINQLDWEMVELLLQGNSLKKIALLQTQPYHRIIYRLNQLITRLGLPSRQRFLHLIHRLNVTSLHLI